MVVTIADGKAQTLIQTQSLSSFILLAFSVHKLNYPVAIFLKKSSLRQNKLEIRDQITTTYEGLRNLELG